MCGEYGEQAKHCLRLFCTCNEYQTFFHTYTLPCLQGLEKGEIQQWNLLVQV